MSLVVSLVDEMLISSVEQPRTTMIVEISASRCLIYVPLLVTIRRLYLEVLDSLPDW